MVPKQHLGFNITFFLVFVLLAVLHIYRLLVLDAISLSLLFIGLIPLLLPYINKTLLPYINQNFKSFEIFGIKAELAQKIAVQNEKIDKHEDTLRQQGEIILDLVRYSMSASIFKHLCGISLLKIYNYDDTDANRREMYFLRDNGYIRPKKGDFVDFNNTVHRANLVDIAEPTPIGKYCVKLRIADMPEELKRDIQNLRMEEYNNYMMDVERALPGQEIPREP